MSTFKVMLSGEKQFQMLNEFIEQEILACRKGEPEVVSVFGNNFPIDLLHPAKDKIVAMSFRLCKDGSKLTVVVCKPQSEMGPTIIQWPDKNAEVMLCPNAVLVIRPTEPDDLVFE